MLPNLCSNCRVYNWPSEGVPVLRCSNCKFVSYCSPECQREHWKKVHKEQCKTLAGQVAHPASAHLPDSCPGCIVEKDLGTEAINSQDCPLWGCLLGPQVKGFLRLNGKFPSAVDSGDMSRTFITRNERTMFMMLQIVNKVVKSNPRLSQKCRSEITQLDSLLTEYRLKLISLSHHFPAKLMINGYRSFSIGFKEFKDVIYSINSSILGRGVSAGDPFLAWESWKLLAGFLFTSTLHYNLKDFERLGMKNDLPSEIRKMVGELGSSALFEKIWDRVLEVLKAGLVHHYTLLDIMCEGNRNQECYRCKKSIVIERMFVSFITTDEDSMLEKPFVTFKRRKYSCAAVNCQNAARKENTDFLNQVAVVMQVKLDGAVARENICDNCFNFGKRVHRCSQCKTKVYCSKECQVEDWGKIHEKICNKGEVERKVKVEKGVRKDEAGKEQVDKVTAEIVFNKVVHPVTKLRCLDIVEKIQ